MAVYLPKTCLRLRSISAAYALSCWLRARSNSARFFKLVEPETRSRATCGRIWLIVIPLIVATFIESLIPLGGPAGRDFGAFIGSDTGKVFLQGAWGWYALMLVWFVFNTVLGEELLFRGLLLPRMKGVFKRRDWLANGVLFAFYHLHVPWVIPGTLLVDTFAVAYPARRYQSAWIGIAVHSAQSVFFAVLIFTLVV